MNCPKCGCLIFHWCYSCAVAECPSHPNSTNPSKHDVFHILGDNDCEKWKPLCKCGHEEKVKP